MTTLEFFEIRKQSLREFFKGRFGRNWVDQIGARIDRWHAPHWLRNKSQQASYPSLVAVETLATSLGYKCPLHMLLRASERKTFEKLMFIVNVAQTQFFHPDFAPTFYSLCCTQQHRIPRPRLVDDVLPLDALPARRNHSPAGKKRLRSLQLSKSADNEGKALGPLVFTSPVVPNLNPELQQVAADARAAVDRQATADQQVTDEANGTGGARTPPEPLSASRAIKEEARGEFGRIKRKHRDNRPGRYRDLITKLLNALDQDANALEESKARALCRVHRQVEGLLLKRELDRKLARREDLL